MNLIKNKWINCEYENNYKNKHFEFDKKHKIINCHQLNNSKLFYQHVLEDMKKADDVKTANVAKVKQCIENFANNDVELLNILKEVKSKGD